MAEHALTFQPGDVVAGRYRIEAQIGRGGVGVVFRATQLALGRTVALKMLLPHALAATDGLVRFRREAKLAQSLEHPNTVRLYDFGETDSGVPFIAFEYLKGESLDALLKRGGGLPPERVAHIGAQILKSLMEAHAQNIVHRDIKPSNIFLCTYSGETDFVKLLDFGIAKNTKSTTHQGVTRAGAMLGTPAYMAPEQVSGGEVTSATDLYALGLVLAEALSGKVVFAGDSQLGVAMAQISDEPAPLAPSVLQTSLGPVILRATQKDPAKRYASAEEMLRYVEGHDAAIVVRPSFASTPEARPPVSVMAPTERGSSVEPPAPPASLADSGAPTRPSDALVVAAAAAPVAAAPARPVRMPSRAWRIVRWLFALAVIGAGVAVALRLGGRYVRRTPDPPDVEARADAAPPTQRPAPTAEPVRTTVAETRPPPHPKRPSWATSGHIRSRIQAMNFRISAETLGEPTTFWVIQRGNLNGQVQLLHCAGVMAATAAEETAKSAEYPTVRDGVYVLIVMWPDGTVGKRLADHIVR